MASNGPMYYFIQDEASIGTYYKTIRSKLLGIKRSLVGLFEDLIFLVIIDTRTYIELLVLLLKSLLKNESTPL